MRITGGQWRSRRILGPSKGMPLRPTPDALRERAFAVLGAQVEGARFLDLYAGTGAVGLEALSRGARILELVEAHPAAAGLIARNLTALGVGPERAHVLVRPAAAAVVELGRRGASFDLAWADPPFERWLEGLETLLLAARSGVLAAGAVACLECPDQAVLPTELAPLERRRDLTGGASRLVLLGLTADRPTGGRDSGTIPGS